MNISRSDLYTYVASLFASDLLDAEGNVVIASAKVAILNQITTFLKMFIP